jgi:hypothetical protein
MTRLLSNILALALISGAVGFPSSVAAADDESATSAVGGDAANALEVWKAEHRWFRLGMRFYGVNPAIDEHAVLKTGAAVSVPLTTDFFMGIGMRLAFVGSYNSGQGCVTRAGGDSANCPDGQSAGVDYIWRQPLVDDGTGGVLIDGSNGNAQPGSSFVDPQRRESHVAAYSLSIGANYELTIPTVKVFRHFQPFFGGGVVIAWIYTYSDITANEFVLINNSENDPWDDDNLDPWSSQGPQVGGEVYGGFHINIGKAFRFTFEVGYHSFDVPAEELNKATDGYEAQHLSYSLSQTRFGGGFELRF